MFWSPYLRIADRLLDLHALPVGVEFVGEQSSGSEVRMPVPISERCGDDVDRAVGVDAEVDVGMQNGAVAARDLKVVRLRPKAASAA